MEDCLHAAVTLAKSEQIRSVRALRSRLTQYGFSAIEIKSALGKWAQYLKEHK